MNKIIYALTIAVLLTSCGTTKKNTVLESVPVPPEGINFTTIKDYKRFLSIQMPYEGKGFSKQESGSYYDAGEMIPTARFYGMHIKVWSDLSGDRYIKDFDLKDDVYLVFENIKKKGAYGLKSYFKNENTIKEITDITIGNKQCMRYLLSYDKNNYTYYVLGYIVPHNETTAWFTMQNSRTEPEFLRRE